MGNSTAALGTRLDARLTYETGSPSLALDDGTLLQVLHACYMPHPGAYHG